MTIPAIEPSESMRQTDCSRDFDQYVNAMRHVAGGGGCEPCKCDRCTTERAMQDMLAKVAFQ